MLQSSCHPLCCSPTPYCHFPAFLPLIPPPIFTHCLCCLPCASISFLPSLSLSLSFLSLPFFPPSCFSPPLHQVWTGTTYALSAGMILEALSRSDGSRGDGDGDGDAGYQRAGERTLSDNTDQVTALWGLGQEGVGGSGSGRGRAVISALMSEAEADSNLVGPQEAGAAGRTGGSRVSDGCDTRSASDTSSNTYSNSYTDSSITGDEPSSGCPSVPLLSRQELLDMAFTTARGIHDAVRS
jgi:hypothetical protein